jgi:4,5-DOPA dioxygenase extradiol
MPVVFVGHGNPMNAIEDNEFHRAWAELGTALPKPKAVLCISAHWETRGLYLTSSARPPTIHDFYGFPQALFDVIYPAPGERTLASRAARLLIGFEADLDQARGLDHGAWSVLAAMYPEADVPVVPLSLDTSRPGSFRYKVGKALTPLREEAVLILGSGNIAHNLGLFRFNDLAPLDWAVNFDEKVKPLVEEGEHGPLLDPVGLGPESGLAVPTPKHYFPFLCALGLQIEGEGVRFFCERVLSSISMTSLVIGG